MKNKNTIIFYACYAFILFIIIANFFRITGYAVVNGYYFQINKAGKELKVIDGWHFVGETVAISDTKIIVGDETIYYKEYSKRGETMGTDLESYWKVSTEYKYIFDFRLPDNLRYHVWRNGNEYIYFHDAYYNGGFGGQYNGTPRGGEMELTAPTKREIYGTFADAAANVYRVMRRMKIKLVIYFVMELYLLRRAYLIWYKPEMMPKVQKKKVDSYQVTRIQYRAMIYPILFAFTIYLLRTQWTF